MNDLQQDRLVIAPGLLKGDIAIQSSKSACHRGLICACLSDETSKLHRFYASQDTVVTKLAMQNLRGNVITEENDTLVIGAGHKKGQPSLLDCGESGSALRFLLPVSLCDGGGDFIGKGRLLERPMAPFETLFKEKNITFIKNEDKISVRGQLTAGTYALQGDISSQFVSGLLFALPLLEGDSQIILTTPLQSRPYVEMTREMQKNFGVRSRWLDKNTLAVKGSQRYHGAEVTLEGDYSHAAFFAVAGALGGDVTLTGLLKNTHQGDRSILSILSRMGAQVEGFRVQGGDLKGITIDAKDIPDLVPPLAVAACGAKGRTVIYGAERLRMKESDRLSAMTRELLKLGAQIEETSDGLIIEGTGRLKGGSVEGHNDHRIAMALAVASGCCEGEIILQGGLCTRKSAPHFFEEFKQLGGQVHE